MLFFAHSFLLRAAEDGTYYHYDPESKTEKVWLNFAATEGQSLPTSIDQCTRSAKIDSRATKFSGPIGETDQALRVSYEPSCADAGVQTDVFIPYVGLAERTVSTFAGPRKYELIYSRTGPTVLADKEVSFALALDKSVYTAGVTMLARLTLRSTQSEPIPLVFPSGQDYDLVFKNDKGEVVYRWSDGKGFTLVFREEKFGPGEKNFAILATLGSGGINLPAGKYTAEAWLATNPKQYIASVAFEVR